MPIEQNAFYATLGLAMRAGALSLGEEGVLKAIASGKTAFVLVDEGASDNTKKRFRDSCAHYGVELFQTQRDRLGAAIGKPGRMSAAVAKGGLGDRLLSMARGE